MESRTGEKTQSERVSETGLRQDYDMTRPKSTWRASERNILVIVRLGELIQLEVPQGGLSLRASGPN